MGSGKQFIILMLDDDHDDRHITETVFAEKGYDVKLEFLDESDKVLTFLEDASIDGTLPHLILLDLNMPRKNGFEVLKEIKSHFQFRQIPVVIISGTAYHEEVKECYLLGANSFVQKPLTDKLTQKKIETFVDYWFTVCELPIIQSEPNIAL